MWKLRNNYRNEENFAKWALATERKVPKTLIKEFKESWPEVQNADELIRGAFVTHWELIMGKPVSEVAMSVTIGSLSYLQLAANNVGRQDLVQVLQSMMQNIPRIRHEINEAHLDEEE